MIHTLTKKQLEELLAQTDFDCSLDDDGDFFTVIEGDDDFPYDVILWFVLNENGEILTTIARCTDLELDDVLRVANNYNSSNNFLTAVADEKEHTLGFDASYDVEGLTEDYIVKNCIFNFGVYVWRAYCEIYQNLED